MENNIEKDIIKEDDNLTYINKAKKNSFNPIAYTPSGNMVMNQRFFALALAVVTALGVTITSLVKDISSDVKENKMVADFLHENGGYLTSKYGWHGTNKDDYGFNHEGIAKGILNSSDPDLALYAVYDGLGELAHTGYDGVSNIDRVISEMDEERVEKGETPYGSFLGYLESKGTTLEVYEANMPQYVEGEAKKADAQKQVDESGMKF